MITFCFIQVFTTSQLFSESGCKCGHSIYGTVTIRPRFSGTVLDLPVLSPEKCVPENVPDLSI